jgi:flagellar basal body rod protein FlgC
MLKCSIFFYFHIHVKSNRFSNLLSIVQSQQIRLNLVFSNLFRMNNLYNDNKKVQRRSNPIFLNILDTETAITVNMLYGF